ncbi:hypothetical protein M2103_000903 [Ereboglobus sp. PH5-5]|nr:hypothetical protein [Ereboglobus sp. PH5-10]MDF9832689.1 hypothetical protein [Ereboglobus sp. PH5-5]
MPRKKQIPYRNQSPTGWWIYEESKQQLSVFDDEYHDER